VQKTKYKKPLKKNSKLQFCHHYINCFGKIYNYIISAKTPFPIIINFSINNVSNDIFYCLWTILTTRVEAKRDVLSIWFIILQARIIYQFDFTISINENFLLKKLFSCVFNQIFSYVLMKIQFIFLKKKLQIF